MAQVFNFIDNTTHISIETIVNNVTKTVSKYGKDTLSTKVKFGKLFIDDGLFPQVIYDYNIDTCNINSTNVFDLQDQLDFIFNG